MGIRGGMMEIPVTTSALDDPKLPPSKALGKTFCRAAAR